MAILYSTYVVRVGAVTFNLRHSSFIHHRDRNHIEAMMDVIFLTMVEDLSAQITFVIALRRTVQAKCHIYDDIIHR